MQKLVTIYLSAWKVEHGAIEEHLASYMKDGWRVVDLTAAGGGGESANACNVWAIVLLEKDDH